MEETIFQIYGTFILTLAGFVLPLIAIALSAFPEGVKSLRRIYENEQKQSEKNLSDELEKQKTNKEIDYDVLEKNIHTLKSTKKKARKRLLYLDPNYILSRSAIAIGFSIMSFFIGLIFYGQYLNGLIISFLISFSCLIWTVVIFFNSIGIIIEASSTVQGIRRETDEKVLELLTALVDNSKKGDLSLFVEQKNIKVFWGDEEVTANKEFILSVNNKHKVKIFLKNLSEHMLKTVELGFALPVECLVEGKSISSTYTGEKEKIIRFKHDYIHANVNQIEGDIEITFLKIGTFDVNAFVKGENLKNKTIKFKIKVVE